MPIYQVEFTKTISVYVESSDRETVERAADQEAKKDMDAWHVPDWDVSIAPVNGAWTNAVPKHDIMGVLNNQIMDAADIARELRRLEEQKDFLKSIGRWEEPEEQPPRDDRTLPLFPEEALKTG